LPGWLEGAEKALKLGGGEFYAGNQEFFFEKSYFFDNYGSSFFSIDEDR